MNNEIPKIIHYCWFGRGEKSSLIKKCIESWKKYCPDYEIKEWNEDNFKIDSVIYVKEAYENKKWAFVSDYVRLWVIYNYGGIYMDTDVELIKPLDELLKYDSFFSIEISEYVNTGLGFGAKKNNQLVKRMLDDYEDEHFIMEKKDEDLLACPIRNTNSIKDIYAMIEDKKIMKVIDNNAFLSADYFCPFNPKTGKMKKTQNTLGIHWFNASWRSKKTNVKGKLLRPIKRLIGVNNFEKIKKIIKNK